MSEEYETRVKAAAKSKAGYLSQAELTEILDLADHAEPDVAYEMLCNQLYEHYWPVTLEDYNELDNLGRQMGLRPSALDLWERELKDGV